MRGYLVIAQNTERHDYIRLAYALALSIKNTQTEVTQFAIAVPDGTEVPEKYKGVFDHIVIIPWGDHAEKSDWKIENKWKYLHMTPFEETVILDADMIFTSDISYWWDIMAEKDVWATTNVYTYRGDVITSEIYRKAFVDNNLPNVYTAFMYFKKTELTSNLFTMAEIIFNHWERFYYDFLVEGRPKFLSGDVSFALAMQILGIELECTGNTTTMPAFVHMKGKLQADTGTKNISEDWRENYPSYYMDDGRLKIGNFMQLLPFHYHIKEWMTDDIIASMEKLYAS